MRATLLSALSLFAFIGTAEAEILSGGALFGSPSQTTAVCYVYNSGNTAITIRQFRITSQSGAVFPLSSNECGAFPAVLPGFRSCGIAVAANNQAFNCRADVSSKANARGVFEMRNSAGVSLTNVQLR